MHELKPNTRYIIATIRVAIECEQMIEGGEEAWASDTINETLNIMLHDLGSSAPFHDWSIEEISAERRSSDEPEEGELFRGAA